MVPSQTQEEEKNISFFSDKSTIIYETQGLIPYDANSIKIDTREEEKIKEKEEEIKEKEDEKEILPEAAAKEAA